MLVAGVIKDYRLRDKVLRSFGSDGAGKRITECICRVAQHAHP